MRVHRGELPAALLCDAVLVDAPCSELGTLRRGPDARFRSSRAEAEALPARQRALLELAALHVRPGGRIVYATCTLRRAENEAVIALAHTIHRILARGNRELASVLPGGADRV